MENQGGAVEEIERLKSEIAAKNELIERFTKSTADLTTDRDKWKRVAMDRQTTLDRRAGEVDAYETFIEKLLDKIS